jgi:hypothetical protein
MTTKFLTLISVIGIASICVVQAQSPSPTESPSRAEATDAASPAEASPSPTAKPTRTPKATPATSPAASPGEKRTGKAKATPAKRGTTAATPAAVGGPGMVWVNTDTHTYHKQGSRFYGKTKTGKYMSEAEARKEGNRPARQENF